MTIFAPQIRTLWRVLDAYGVDPARVIPAELYRPGVPSSRSERLSLEVVDDLMKQYSDRRAIVTSHYLLDPDGSFGDGSLFVNDGDGRFTDVTEKAGLKGKTGGGRGGLFADVDNDGRLDLFLFCTKADRLFLRLEPEDG